MAKDLFNSNKLTTARLSRGFTIKDLAEKTGISRQSISNYESGKSSPRENNIVLISKVLNFPISFFSSENVILNSNATFFRSRSSATKKKRIMQEKKLEFSKKIFDVLSEYVEFPKLNLPNDINKDFNNIENEDIEEMANSLREKWKISKNVPFPNITRFSEMNGIIISKANMADSKLDAVSKWISGKPYIMLTDNNESSVRRRFNIAHEIGHLLLHSSVENIDDLSNKEMKIIENQANDFASNLLLPKDGFSKSLISLQMDSFIRQKAQWKVSIQSMIYRVHQLGIISDNQYIYLNKKISFNKWRKNEPYDDKIKLEEPKLFYEVYELLIKNNVLSNNDLKIELSLPNDELNSVFNKEIFNDDENIEYKQKFKLHLI